MSIQKSRTPIDISMPETPDQKRYKERLAKARRRNNTVNLLTHYIRCINRVSQPARNEQD